MTASQRIPIGRPHNRHTFTEGLPVAIVYSRIYSAHNGISCRRRLVQAYSLSTRRKRVRESARNGFACLFACLRFVLVSGAFLLSQLAGYLLSAACLLSSGCPVLAGRP